MRRVRLAHGERVAMGLLLRPNRPLLRAAAGATTTRAFGMDEREADRSLGRGRLPTVDASPMAVPSSVAAARRHPASWSETMQMLLRLSRLHRAGELSDREFTIAVNRLIGT
jgi:hypothetical protein